MSEPRGRPFEAGNTIGRGRPKGSRNKARSEAQDLLDQYTPQVVKTCLAQASKGNSTALRLCMERILPAPRDGHIRMSLARIRTAADVDKASEQVTRQIVRGGMTPAEGEAMMNILESRTRVIAQVIVERRLEKVEEIIATYKPPLAA